MDTRLKLYSGNCEKPGKVTDMESELSRYGLTKRSSKSTAGDAMLRGARAVAQVFSHVSR
jgi:hypothetical protein